MSTIALQTLWDVSATDGHPSQPPIEVTRPSCGGHGTIVPTLAHSRSVDPETAQAAGDAQEDAVRFHDQSRQARALKEIAITPGTALAVAYRVLGADTPVARIEGMRRRVSSLARLGLVEDSGSRETNTGSNRLAIVWQITDAGHEVLVRLGRTGWSC